jgi:hypothetical protein
MVNPTGRGPVAGRAAGSLPVCPAGGPSPARRPPGNHQTLRRTRDDTHPLALIAAIAAAAAGVATVQHTQAAATFAYFDPTNLGEGTLDGVGFTVTVDSNGLMTNTSTGNFNTAAYDFAGSQTFLQYYGTTVTITFDEAISDLSLYLHFFRGGAQPNDAGADSYTFNQSFSINANFDGGSQNGNVLETPGTWANGILSFSGAITSLSWTS